MTDTNSAVPPAPTTGSTGSSPAAGAGWQVWPGQVTTFATAVQQVRDDLNAVFSQVDQLTSTAYHPQLGSSPTGQSLTDKFVDRLSGDQGLLTQLRAVLSNLDKFVSNAEHTANQYTQADSTAASGLGTPS